MIGKDRLPSETAPDTGAARPQASTAPRVGPLSQIPGAAALPVPPPAQARGGNHFPNVDMIAHTGERFRLYDDLIRNRVVMVNFMSIKGHEGFPATEHLARIADRLGPALDRQVFIYSITTDPVNDTPERLKAFAARFGARPGWYFLTSARREADKAKRDTATASRRLYKHGAHMGGHPPRIVHYGNGGVGVWGAFGVDVEPGTVVERIAWLQPGTKQSDALRRGGPRRLDQPTPGHNRA